MERNREHTAEWLGHGFDWETDPDTGQRNSWECDEILIHCDDDRAAFPEMIVEDSNEAWCPFCDTTVDFTYREQATA